MTINLCVDDVKKSTCCEVLKTSGACELFQTLFSRPNIKEKKVVWPHKTNPIVGFGGHF